MFLSNVAAWAGLGRGNEPNKCLVAVRLIMTGRLCCYGKSRLKKRTDEETLSSRNLCTRRPTSPFLNLLFCLNQPRYARQCAWRQTSKVTHVGAATQTHNLSVSRHFRVLSVVNCTTRLIALVGAEERLAAEAARRRTIGDRDAPSDRGKHENEKMQMWVEGYEKHEATYVPLAENCRTPHAEKLKTSSKPHGENHRSGQPR